MRFDSLNIFSYCIFLFGIVLLPYSLWKFLGTSNTKYTSKYIFFMFEGNRTVLFFIDKKNFLRGGNKWNNLYYIFAYGFILYKSVVNTSQLHRLIRLFFNQVKGTDDKAVLVWRLDNSISIFFIKWNLF